MVLLTSSQVSIVITTIIIFLFTSALFLSGYVLQQQTVRDLRAAIKPREEPPPQAKLYLPKQFQEARPSPKEEGVVVEVQVEGKTSLNSNEGSVVDLDRPAVYQRPVPQPGSRQGGGNEMQDIEGGEGMAEKTLSSAERRKKIKAEIMEGSEEAGFKGYRRRRW